MQNSARILSTALLDQQLINKAADAGILINVVPFVQVVDVTDENDLQEQIEEIYTNAITVVFTSVNAVRAVCETAYFSKPEWTIYCIAHATKNTVLEYFNASLIQGVANDANALAELIKQDGVKEVYFFCGDKRMDTLPDILHAASVTVNEVIVYQTIEAPKFVGETYNGILFFSPSGVNSFFSLNTIEADTVLFAIGETTAKAIGPQTNNNVIIGELPSKEKLIDTAIQYFKHSASFSGVNKKSSQ